MCPSLCYARKYFREHILGVFSASFRFFWSTVVDALFKGSTVIGSEFGTHEHWKWWTLTMINWICHKHCHRHARLVSKQKFDVVPHEDWNWSVSAISALQLNTFWCISVCYALHFSLLRVAFSDISSIDHLALREFVSGPPRYHLAIKRVREQFVIVEQNSGP